MFCYLGTYAGDRMGTTLFKAYPRLSIAITPLFLRLFGYENSRYLLQKHLFFMAYLFYFYAISPICIISGGFYDKRCANCGLLSVTHVLLTQTTNKISDIANPQIRESQSQRTK